MSTSRHAPQGLTWLFSHQIADQANPAPELSMCKELFTYERIQYLAYHVTTSVDTGRVFIRGIVRLLVPVVASTLEAFTPLATFKPFRCIFKPAVVAQKLRASSRVGDLYEYGNITLKRTSTGASECTGSCKSCCLVNKRIKL